jgi:uncharacterized protein YggU (UPF0235/DUF167 family)
VGAERRRKGTREVKGKPGGEAFVLWVRARPRSRTDQVLGWGKDGFLEIQVRAVPERGEANQSCRRQLARLLDVPPSRISLEKGQTSTRKKFRVEGLGQRDGEKALEKALQR